MNRSDGAPNLPQNPISLSRSLRDLIDERAGELGFDAVRVARPDAIPEAATRLRAFIAAGRHGDMDWLATTADRRGDPKALWPDVRSVVMVAISYAPEADPLAALAERSRGVVSAYAKGRDYHDLIKGRLKLLAQTLATAGRSDVKVFVDTAPLMEKPLAAAAGIGWQGKHTNLVSRTHGSWLFLGAILTTAELAPDPAETDHCGTCRRCLDICPTDAFPEPYVLDPRRCIAYLTIEHKGHIAREFREAIGNRVFGCDDCLAVCPWNKFAERAREVRFHARTETDNPPLAELLAMSDADFRMRFAGTPVKRTGRDRVVRNALIAAGNSGDPELLGAVEQLAADPSPLVRAMAAWAGTRLASSERFDDMRSAALRNERDQDVRAEWLAGNVEAI